MTSRVLARVALATACSAFAFAGAVAAELLTPSPDEARSAVPPVAISPADQRPIRTVEDAGGHQIQVDVSGKGAVLCLWNMIVIVEAYPEHCGWSAMPADRAIADAMLQTESFIVANSTTPVTLNQLAERRRQVWEESASFASTQDSLCDIEGNGAAATIWEWRKTDPEELRTLVQHALSVPREPVMNPCL